jgi:CRISPR-associated protein Cas5t
MRVARVEIRAPVTSFRHPFFVTGRQPTFDFPPPSTIFGHCASALGDWPDPATFFFGIHFVYKSKVRDLEHQHITTPLGSKTRIRVETASGPALATTEINVQPVVRDFLFDTTMTLYLPTSLAAAFRAPVYPVVLGRSQDLAEVKAIDEIDLVHPVRARIEHTLLPTWVRPCVRFGSTVLLSRYIAPPPKRDATFAQYISLHDPVFFGEEEAEAKAFVKVDGISLDDLWVDPDPVIADEEGRGRGVWFHRLVD